MGAIRRARAALMIDTEKTSSVMGRAKGMNAGMGANVPLFPAPNPALSVIVAQTVVVDKAEVVAATGVKGGAAARNVQLGILVGMLEMEMGYVQSVADKSSTPEQAVSTIEAAGLTVARVGSHTKPILGVKQGPQAGSVVLDANAAALTGKGRKKTFFNWAYTVDGGKTFIAMPSTPKAKTTLANLTPLTTVGFRVSVTRSDGTTDEWSQVIAFLVH